MKAIHGFRLWMTALFKSDPFRFVDLYDVQGVRVDRSSKAGTRTEDASSDRPTIFLPNNLLYKVINFLLIF